MNITSYETKELETERLILKKGTIEDYVKVYEYDLTKLRDIAGEFVYEKLDDNIIRDWFDDDIEAYHKKHEKNHTFDWIMYEKETNKPIGNIMADREKEELNSIELAFNIHPHYWGKGYIVETLHKVLNHLYQIGYDNVISGWDEGNKKSQRVSEKLGFKLFNYIENYWIKNGIPVATYETIMSKEEYQNTKKKR